MLRTDWQRLMSDYAIGAHRFPLFLFGEHLLPEIICKGRQPARVPQPLNSYQQSSSLFDGTAAEPCLRPSHSDAMQNESLAGLPALKCERWLPQLEAVDLPLGKLLYESGSKVTHVYFPTPAIVSLLYVMKNGHQPKSLRWFVKDSSASLCLWAARRTDPRAGAKRRQGVQVAGEPHDAGIQSGWAGLAPALALTRRR